MVTLTLKQASNREPENYWAAISSEFFSLRSQTGVLEALSPLDHAT